LTVAQAAANAQSGLRWGTLFATGPAAPAVTRYRAQVIERAKQSSNKKFVAVEWILSEGKLATEPGVAESRAATKEIPTVLKLAVCARLTGGAACRSAATQGLLAWARVYKPDGNPINENELIPLIQAWDIMKPLLTPHDEKVMEAFGRTLIAAGDQFYSSLKPTDGRFYNNWGTWRLCVRSLTSVVLADRELMSSSRELVRGHLQHNLMPNGASIDFYGRDALHYHVYDLQAFATMAAFMPSGFFSDADLALVEKGLDFLEPFFTGKERHVEFVNSKVPFDIKRREAGLAEYQNAPWKPENARPLLRLARAAFPGIRPWSQSAVDEYYDPMLKLEAAALGDQ
jgi:hypothetical protein